MSGSISESENEPKLRQSHLQAAGFYHYMKLCNRMCNKCCDMIERSSVSVRVRERDERELHTFKVGVVLQVSAQTPSL